MSRPRVLVTSSLPGDALEVLERSARVDLHAGDEPLGPDELLDRVRDCDALVCLLTDRITESVLASAGLKLVANVAVGYDNIDMQAATRRGVLVTNTPGVLDETTADLAFGLLLACARRIAEADRYVRAGRWHRWKPDLMLGTDVHGKTLGLVGFGRIGQAVARRALAFDMTVLYTRSRDPDNSGARSPGPGPHHVRLEELLSQSDFISIHCPLNERTRHLLGERELSMLKPCCLLINTSRGPIVDQAALVAALADGRLGGAGLDVFEDEPRVPPELLAMDRVVLTPHIGSASIETRAAMARLAVDGLLLAFSGSLPPSAVNPQVWPLFLQRARSCLLDR
ncbi:MAG TPA: D-glycerate dehydrogenase [Candidatus Obscuribacterales bacterium]